MLKERREIVRKIGRLGLPGEGGPNLKILHKTKTFKEGKSGPRSIEFPVPERGKCKY